MSSGSLRNAPVKEDEMTARHIARMDRVQWRTFVDMVTNHPGWEFVE
jgi:hypothetical protein